MITYERFKAWLSDMWKRIRALGAAGLASRRSETSGHPAGVHSLHSLWL